MTRVGGVPRIRPWLLESVLTEAGRPTPCTVGSGAFATRSLSGRAAHGTQRQLANYWCRSSRNGVYAPNGSRWRQRRSDATALVPGDSLALVPVEGDAVRGDEDWRHRRIAQDVVSTLLADQLSRGESLNAAASTLAGLAGIVTTLAGIVPTLTNHPVGLAGIASAGLSAVLAVVALATRRPGREPVDIGALVDEIVGTDDVTLTEDVLLYTDVAAARRNDGRLRRRGVLVLLAAFSLAVAVVLLVATMIVDKS